MVTKELGDQVARATLRVLDDTDHPGNADAIGRWSHHAAELLQGTPFLVQFGARLEFLAGLLDDDALAPILDVLGKVYRAGNSLAQGFHHPEPPCNHVVASHVVPALSEVRWVRLLPVRDGVHKPLQLCGECGGVVQ